MVIWRCQAVPAVPGFFGVKKMLKTLMLSILSFLAIPAFAATGGPDLSSLTAAIDFGPVTAAVLGVAAALIYVYIAWKGARLVLNAVKGG